MNTANLKKIAPRARTAFITAIKARAAEFGITTKGHIEPVISGEVLQVAGFTHPASCASALKRLQQRLANDSYETLIEHVAYTWFNRFCAIRFMELKSEEGYLEHGVRLLSHPSQPQGFEVLDRAPEVIDSLITEGVALDKPTLLDLLLAGNEQETLFRELLLAQCHRLHQAMPFLFEAIDDETELLLPTGLIRTDAFWRELIDEIPEPDWQQVEVIGWLYQFYISEKKEQVIGKVVKSADIPAATQLFTPNWIVQYLVQNSVGRHWLQTYPESAIKSALPYYIDPCEQAPAVVAQLTELTPASIEPESIRVLDPACGSGHILVEAYNVLYRIYEERGYRSREIPELILRHNLFGLDIDDRAAQLASFALLMRARQDDRRVLNRSNLRLNIVSLQESLHLNINNLWQQLNLNQQNKIGSVGDMFAENSAKDNIDSVEYQLLTRTLKLFLNAKTLGSLIQVPAEDEAALHILKDAIYDLKRNGDIQQRNASEKLYPYIEQAWILSQKYNVVVSNPPYMGLKYFNEKLKKEVVKHFPLSKHDLFAMFIERNLNFLCSNGISSQITMLGWLYIQSYSHFREKIIKSNTFLDLNELGSGAFGNSVGTVVKTAITTLSNTVTLNYKTRCKNKKTDTNQDIRRFLNFPNQVITPFLNDNEINDFINMDKLDDVADVRQGLSTSDDQRFLRYWYEVDNKKLTINTGKKWVPLNKGGDVRKWYGNNLLVINWENDGHDVITFAADKYGSATRTIKNQKYYFRPGLTWGRITGDTPSFRYFEKGFIISDKGCGIYTQNENDLLYISALLNSPISKKAFNALSPNFGIEAGHIKSLPIKLEYNNEIIIKIKKIISIYKNDWDSSELSYNFNSFYLNEMKQSARISDWINSIIEKHTEIEHIAKETESYIYDYIVSKYSWDLLDFNDYKQTLFSEHDKLISYFLHYTIGCMMGRYSLDRQGLIYAHAGNEGFKALVEDSAYDSFQADSDGILPMTYEAWFKDDITARVEEFVCIVWGTETLEENLQFIADSLCRSAIKPIKKGGETSRETIRRYLSTQFFKDHLKTYKKRPIYWLFSSGKEKAFECLVYLHRYNEATLPRMRTEYVTPLLGQMASRIDRLRMQQNEAETAEAKRIGKEIESLTKQLTELRAFDDQLKHYADMKIPLDLDDGVKVNYGKFGTLLAEVKAITGDKAE